MPNFLIQIYLILHLCLTRKKWNFHKPLHLPWTQQISMKLVIFFLLSFPLSILLLTFILHSPSLLYFLSPRLYYISTLPPFFPLPMPYNLPSFPLPSFISSFFSSSFLSPFICLFHITIIHNKLHWPIQ